jgi:Mg-chelatase subunit ChlD
MGFFGSDKTGPARPVQLTKDATGAPAVDLTKVRDAGHTALADVASKAGTALSKRDLSGIRAQVVVLLDRSGSMRSDYASGAVQKLLERALGFALQVDVDGSIPVIPFDDQVWPAVDVNQGNFATIVASTLNTTQMGSTNLAGALEEVKALAEKSDAPLYVLILTDGNPDDKPAATKQVIELARYAAFLKILALRPVDYLSELDDLDSSKRLVDNVDAKPEKGTTLNLLTCSDMEFVEAMADEWDSWVEEAKKAGVLTV